MPISAVWVLFYSIFINNDEISLFQTSMLIGYLIYIFLWILSSINVIKYERITSLILPSSSSIKADKKDSENEKKIKQIIDYYHSILLCYVARECCTKLFGEDITGIILLHLTGDYQQ